MNYKLEGAIRRNKKNFIIFAILWILIAVVFVVPLTHGYYKAAVENDFDLQILIDTFAGSLTNPIGTLGKIFSEGAGGMYFKNVLIATIFYSIFFFVGMARTAPKNRYTDFEHGSSDWAKGGEQYEVLNKDKGIVLAENNYLPVDKRGNVNVLVVGRFWFW